jgi:hypothetical protein
MANPTVARNAKAAQRNPQPLLAPNWFLGLVPREFWNVHKTFFIYEADFVPIGALATASVNTQIQNDSHFLCIAGIGLVTDNTGVTVINSPSNANSSGKLTQIIDVAAGYPLSPVVIPLENLFGSAQLPAMWAIPKLFRKGTTIQTVLQNLVNTAHNVRLSYWGIRLYDQIGSAGGR